MQQHEIEIEIGPRGEVRAHITGAKGKGCLKYAELLKEIVGKITSQELTAEYYEPGEDVEILPLMKQKR